MQARGTGAGVVWLQQPPPAVWEGCTALLVGEGRDRSARGVDPLSNPAWRSTRAIPVFADNNGGVGWPWKPVKILRDKLLGSKNTVREKKLTFRLSESQNSHKCCVLVSSGRTHHHSPRLRRHFVNSMEGAAGDSMKGLC